MEGINVAASAKLKEIAVNMRSNKFKVARDVALMAKETYPKLEKIDQMLKICDVHCSAKRRLSFCDKLYSVRRDKLGSGKDWYGILGMKELADESAVGKQYRRLSLVVHPDKNKFPGALEAFMLISAAKDFLSDRPMKAAYDNMITFFSGSAKANPPNQHQATKFSFFWTHCPKCGTFFQYESEESVNKNLQCEACHDVFFAWEVSAYQGGSQNVPSRPDTVQENVSYNDARPLKRAHTTKEANGKEQKDVVDNEDSKHGNLNSFSAAPGSSEFENKEMGAAHSEESLKNKIEGCEKEGEMGAVTGGKSSAAAETVEVECDSDLDWSSSTNSDTVPGDKSSAAAETVEVESDSDLDWSSSTNSDTVPGDKSSAAAETVEVESDSDLDSFSSSNSETDRFKCLEPEFSNFNTFHDETHFHADQYWACFDSWGCMPRFYAKVTKVHRSPFKLEIKWLNPVPISADLIDWVHKKLPVSCGNFELGEPDIISNLDTVSHQVHEIGTTDNSFIIYPRKGEVWALLRDWDISWSSNPENHKECGYEIVEVLSDFATGVGIKVGYLDKVTGFVCLFQRPSETSSFVIGPTELYKFSHYVPSYKMTGTERGVPEGSFELDTASLPINPDHLYFPSKDHSGSRNKDPTVSSALPKYAEGKATPVHQDW